MSEQNIAIPATRGEGLSFPLPGGKRQLLRPLQRLRVRLRPLRVRYKF